VDAGRLWFSAGWWGFCVFCHPLFLEGRLDLLLARVKTLLVTPLPCDMGDIYQLLPQVITGEPVLWNEGEQRDWKVNNPDLEEETTE
jgi:hypothetical protein